MGCPTNQPTNTTATENTPSGTADRARDETRRDGTNGADDDVARARRHENAREELVFLEFKIHTCFVCFDRTQCVALPNGVALGLEPSLNGSALHRRRQRRHADVLVRRICPIITEKKHTATVLSSSAAQTDRQIPQNEIALPFKLSYHSRLQFGEEQSALFVFVGNVQDLASGGGFAAAAAPAGAFAADFEPEDDGGDAAAEEDEEEEAAVEDEGCDGGAAV
jgi:hypothetical protein